MGLLHTTKIYNFVVLNFRLPFIFDIMNPQFLLHAHSREKRAQGRMPAEVVASVSDQPAWERPVNRVGRRTSSIASLLRPGMAAEAALGPILAYRESGLWWETQITVVIDFQMDKSSWPRKTAAEMRNGSLRLPHDHDPESESQHIAVLIWR